MTWQKNLKMNGSHCVVHLLRQRCKISNKYFQVEQRPTPPSPDSSVREDGLRVKRGKSEEIVLNKHKASHSRQTPSQVWSLTQFYYLDFSQSGIGVKKSAFSTNALSRFKSAVFDSVLGPLHNTPDSDSL